MPSHKDKEGIRIMRKYLLFFVLLLSACTTLQNYNNLSIRDQAFYNLLYVENQNPNIFSSLKTQQERDEYLSKLGYLQKYSALPEHVQKAVLENEIVIGAPEFTVYMAAGMPIKQNRQVTMEKGDIKHLFYLKCADNAGANAGKFVPESGACPTTVSSALLSTVSPVQSQRDPLFAEAMPYVVRIEGGKVVSVRVVEELPR